MPIHVLTNPLIIINGIDLTDHVHTVKLNYKSESVDVSVMGVAARKRKAGLKDWKVDLKFFQDYDAAKTYATLRPLLGATACFEIRPVNACASANNPIVSGIGTMTEFPIFASAVGEAAISDVVLDAFGDLSFASSS